MFVGTARFIIHIPAARSLKERRRVVNQLKDRIRARLSVSVCEVGNAEQYQVARLGVATVSRDAATCRRVIETARTLAESQKDAILADAKAEVLAFGADGEHLGGGIECGTDWISASNGLTNELPSTGESLRSDAIAPLRPHRPSKRLRKEQ
jgi:uncharacterized protein YlxP (DUF503 family)